jgi:hypothetical protein
MFHPRGFSPPRWFTPPDTAQVYCTLLPAMGFATFRGSCSLASPLSRATSSLPAGRCPSPVALHPSKLSPRQKRLSRHRDCYPLDVDLGLVPFPMMQASSSSSPRRGPDLRVLLHCRVRCSRPALPLICYPVLPWASFIRIVEPGVPTSSPEELSVSASHPRPRKDSAAQPEDGWFQPRCSIVTPKSFDFAAWIPPASPD